jgi:hypothetical protein
LYQGYENLFRDSDSGWHIVNGERILTSHQVPDADPFSFSKARQPWIAWEWGADVLVGALHRGGSLRAVAFFYAVAISVVVWMWFRLNWTMGGNFLLAAALSPLLISTMTLHWLARPHVLGWIFLAGALWWAESTKHARPVHALTVAGGMAVWANIHASFVLGWFVLAVYFWRRAPWLLAAGIAAPLMNPYGWRLYEHLFRYLTDAELMSSIGEFKSFDFHASGAAQIALMLLVSMAGGTMALLLGRFEHFALAVVLTGAALRSARVLPIAALLLLPVANAAITETLRERRLLENLRAYGDRLRAIDCRMRGGVWALLTATVAFAVLRIVPVGFPSQTLPVKAYPQVPADARLFTSDAFGGFIIYHSRGTRKVFVDGRSDFYGAEFLRQYGRLVQVRPGWKEYFDSWHFSHALLPNEAPLLAGLELAGWKPVYRDETATLLAADGGDRSALSSAVYQEARQ